MSRPRSPRVSFAARLARVGAAVALAGTIVASPAVARGTYPATVTPPPGLTMAATVLLQGHARIGAWMAIDVRLKNDGPPISGELRLTGGTQGRTRFGTQVEAPTQSDQTHRLYVQPPGFGREVEVSLVDGTKTIATTKATYSVHDGTQMIVGIVAERPGDIIGDLDLLPNMNNVKPLAIGLQPGDLPDRVEAWGSLDRLVWQDVDSNALSPEQITALRGWVAGGGRLIITGGTAGPSSLSAFPEALLPYRPTATTDVAPSSLVALLGQPPAGATDLPALSGRLAAGRALATVGSETVAAERGYGGGAVTLIGFDPTAKWLIGTNAAEGLWRRLIPTRTAGMAGSGDDSQIVQAAAQLPNLALPPVGGLIAILVVYILLIGPINYLVLKRIDRREWAWVTMPVLIVAFAVGAYGFGSLLRGTNVIVNEAAIVRGAPGATEGLAQTYLGVFSPTRASYQIRFPGGALLSSPTNGDFLGDGTAAGLDVLQGDPSRVRDLGVGFGSLRTIRAESAVPVPLVRTALRLEDGRLRGSVTNASHETLEAPAVVLGGTVAKLNDLPPGQTATVDAALQAVQMGQQLSDKIVGQMFFGDPRQAGEGSARQYARHTIIDQLTFDPNWGFTGQLPAEGAVVLAWSDHELLPVDIEGQVARRSANVLWFLPADVTITGKTTFRQDLMRNTVVASDAAFFNKDPFSMNFGRGKADLSFRPIPFDGTIAASQVTLGFNFGEIGNPGAGDPKVLKPLEQAPVACGDKPVEGCVARVFDGLPEVELFDLTTSSWRRLPHMNGGLRYAVDEPAHYVDPTTGTVLVRFINDATDSVGFSLDLTITGDIRP